MNSSIPAHRLEQLRQRMDRIDHELIQLIAQRVAVSNEIGVYKQKNQMAVIQTKRWKELIQDRIDRAGQLGLHTEMVRALYDTLHADSLVVQNDVCVR